MRYRTLNGTVNAELRPTARSKRKNYNKVTQKLVVDGWKSKACGSENRGEHAKCHSLRCSCDCHKTLR
jgi:hypothetical protein